MTFDTHFYFQYRLLYVKYFLATVNNDVNLAVEELSKDESSSRRGGGEGKVNDGTNDGTSTSGDESSKMSEKMRESGEGKSESGGKTLEIELPAGLDPGMEIAVQDPETGKQVTIVVPDNYTPGVKMNVDI